MSHRTTVKCLLLIISTDYISDKSLFWLILIKTVINMWIAVSIDSWLINQQQFLLLSGKNVKNSYQRRLTIVLEKLIPIRKQQHVLCVLTNYSKRFFFFLFLFCFSQAEKIIFVCATSCHCSLFFLSIYRATWLVSQNSFFLFYYYFFLFVIYQQLEGEKKKKKTIWIFFLFMLSFLN